MKIELTTWPLVVLTLPGEPNEDSIHALIGCFRDCFERRERYAVITDTRAVMRLPDAKWRKALSEWTNQPIVRINTERYCVGTATIFSSSLVRGAYTAITWLWKPSCPQIAAASMAEAVDWCCEMLLSANVPLSFRLAELRSNRP